MTSLYYKTEVVRKKAPIHFTTDCTHEDINEGDFSAFFNQNFGPNKPLFGLLYIFIIT
jgi:hypothetical protein